jgi:hypothetical protein
VARRRTALSLTAQTYRGQKFEISGDMLFGFKDDDSFGKIYGYKFTTGEIKMPLQKATTDAGWTWRGVPFGKL